MIRKLVYISLIVLLGSKSFDCQGGTAMEYPAEMRSLSTLEFLLEGTANTESSIREFRFLLHHLSAKQEKFRDQKQFLRYLYRVVHRKALKKYRKYTTIDQTLSRNGTYDCLTGTLLYSLLLDELGFDVTIREFSYHVMLLIQLDDTKILIESTDPLNGFVVGEDAILKRINEYKEQDTYEKKSSVYGFSRSIDQEISIIQLVGLHFYNQAINHLNHLELNESMIDISRAQALFPCERIRIVSKLISSQQVQNLVASQD